MPEQRILMAVIGRPHGVRGLMRVTSYADDLTAYGPLSDDKGRRFVLRWRSEGIAELAELVGDAEAKVADRSAAVRLTNTRLYVDRAQLPEPEEDEFYLADLVGLTVFDAAGRKLGHIAAVHDYGAGASLEIARPDAAPLLVPFTRASVPNVDVAAGMIVVEPPEFVDAAPTRGGGRIDPQGASLGSDASTPVMAGLDPAISMSRERGAEQTHGRVKPGRDEAAPGPVQPDQ